MLFLHFCQIFGVVITIFPQHKAPKLDFHDLLLENVSPMPIFTLQKILDQAKLSLQTPNSQEKHNPFYTIVLTSLVIPVIINIVFLILYCRHCKRNPNSKYIPNCIKIQAIRSEIKMTFSVLLMKVNLQLSIHC